MKFHRLLAAAAVSTLVFSDLSAQVFNFDDLVVGTQVGAYNGATFTNFQVQTSFGPTSPPNFAFNTEATAMFEFAPGFTSFSFTAGVFTPATVSVYSGLGGTGSLLGSLLVTDPPSAPNAFAANSVAFAGVGQSVVVVSSAGFFGWDDISLTAVPEPATWSLMVGGFGLVGIMTRRRRTADA